MALKRQNSTYFLTVEGECERLYFYHLRDLINSLPTRTKNCVFKPDIKIAPGNPYKYALIHSGLNIPFFHVQDIEDYNDSEQKEKFELLLKNLKQAQKIVNYKLGYTNFSFELWMCLHKKDMNVSKGHRREYREDINSSFGTKYQYINEYKKEKNFKDILSKITLEDVKVAIVRAKEIREKNIKKNSSVDDQKIVIYAGYEFFKENPDLDLHLIVEKILVDCLGKNY